MIPDTGRGRPSFERPIRMNLLHRDGELIELTAPSSKLLRYLMRNPRRVLSKDEIVDHVWQYDFGGNAHVRARTPSMLNGFVT